jgi:hypothetical protein
MIKRIRNQGGNKIDAIYLSFGLQAVVNQIVSPQTHYYINLDNAAGNLQAGDHVVSYMSPIGSVPIIGDFFVNAALPYPATEAVGSSGAQGMPFSDVYFLRHDNQGIEMADLVPIGRTELAKIADTVRFYITLRWCSSLVTRMKNYFAISVNTQKWTIPRKPLLFVGSLL